MAATTWHPMSHENPRKWLLANGQVAEETMLESTSGGHRVRSMKHPHIKGPASRADMVRITALREDARAIGTEIVTLYRDQEAAKRLLVRLANNPRLGLGVRDESSMDTSPKMIDLEQTSGTSGSRAWWLYKHPTIDLFVSVHLDLVVRYRWHSAMPEVSIALTSFSPYFIPPASYSESIYPPGSLAEPLLMGLLSGEVQEDFENIFGPTINRGRYGARHSSMRLSELHHQPQLIPPQTWPSPAAAGRVFYGAILSADMTHIEVPSWEAKSLAGYNPEDFKEGWPLTVETVSYKLVDTNVNKAAIEGVAAAYENDVLVKEAIGHYAKFRSSLTQLGFSLPALAKTDLGKLLGGESLTTHIAPATSGQISPPSTHELHLSPATGSIFVVCDKEAIARHGANISEEWERSKAVASITGEDNVLMAFAKAEARKQELAILARREDQAP